MKQNFGLGTGEGRMIRKAIAAVCGVLVMASLASAQRRASVGKPGKC